MPELDLKTFARGYYMLWGYPAQFMVVDNTKTPPKFFDMTNGIYFEAVELPPDQIFRHAVELPSPVVAYSLFTREPVRKWTGAGWERSR